MMISNNNSESSNSGEEYKKILDSFSEKIKIKDSLINKNNENKENNNNNYNNNKVYTITLSGNGAEPPFKAKGLILDHLGTLRIIIPAGLEVASLNPIIYTNYPSLNEQFQREKYSVFHKGPVNPYSGNNDLIFEQKIEKYGCFDYYVEWEDVEEGKTKRGELGTFQINPVLKINDFKLPSDGIILETFLTKCMGPLKDWEKHISMASKLGYNMIHYTPVQEIGASGSSYSIYDQQSISSKIFEPEKPTEQEKLQQLSQFIDRAEKEHNVLGMIDLVWNHTAHNSKWLNEHPEAGYNTDNSPHLKAAVLLDQTLCGFGKSLYGKEIESVEALEKLVKEINDKVIAPLKLWEYYVLNIEKEVEIFKNTYHSSNRVREAVPSSGSTFSPSFLKNIINNPTSEKQEMIKNISKNGTIRAPSYDRYSLHINLDYTYKILDSSPSFGPLTPEEQIQKYEDILKIVNLQLYREYDHDVEAIIKNITERIKYERISSHGPRLGVISSSKPLLNSYFTFIQFREPNGSIREIPLANNGWIFNHNPTIDFASSESRAYLRRDVIIWGDCVKMRYGNSPSDNPWLWEHMKTYTQKMARIFHAIRIDNCHSTPIHLAQYLLDAAREVRPDIYVTCELFTGSEEIDDIFVKKLGINSLIREAMQCHDPSEFSRVVYRYGGSPIGSVHDCEYHSKYPSTSQSYNTKPLKPTLPPALFMDCTHDNETPYQKRTVYDTLPNAAIVTMTVSAIGSTRGYDEIFPKTIDLVNETRLYNPNLNLSSGILPVRTLLNKLHLELSVNDYSETHIHQDGNLLFIQRYSPSLNQSIFCLSHSAFSSDQNNNYEDHEIIIPSKITELIFGARITNVHNNNQPFESKDLLKGFNVDCEILYSTKVLNQMCHLRDLNHDVGVVLKLKYFPKGSILIFRGELPKDCVESIKRIESYIGDQNKLNKTFENINLIDMNVLLYRINEEEKSVTGHGAYHLDNIGELPFCGLSGFVSVLKNIHQYNDLGHPLCENLRKGNWALDYISGRLNQRPNLSSVKDWLNYCFVHLKRLPRNLVPMYFYQIIITAYRASVDKSISLMPSFIQNANWFVHKLAVTTIQFFGVSTPLISNPNVLEGVQDREASLAAGFPHFATGYMRSWGRDTFISLRGILLVTGRYQEAINIIVGFGACLRFGLIPNLLDCGTKPRFNSRDSVWWYLRAIQDTYNCLPSEKEKEQFLQTKVYRLFSPPEYVSPYSTVSEIIQEILQAHASGIHFREPNAGREIDDRMRDEGFNIDIDLNRKNGFLYGGNRSNCGTWMDKMGESTKANNYGEPATPRDGAPIEITAMLYSTVSWLSSLYSSGKFKFGGVDLADESDKSKVTSFTYDQWSKLIQANFEKFYYIPSSNEDKQYTINTSYVHRRYIYKDVVGSANIYQDYQFRPNLCVAMSFAPQLFDNQHASKCIDVVRSHLAGPLGMKTLDPNDPSYHGNYDNAADSGYKPTSKGFNYHNGPEWVWVYGFFLESIIQFKHYPNISTKNHLIEGLLVNHKNHIQTSPRSSLPELTNRDGHYCRDSCDSQAWSIATILGALDKLSKNKN
ncbi:hypothetical protein DICPUDRAFT_45888 [Dictyostelium purpureum]|uniref:Glycogen debranching enzyme n=1 Tax=Dictyostelium purpureum TaxID=5786 RepID=F0ZCG6_DICPU|nr:uncharacterized protein DICPUDRAFT_45888 [Dictyostelium purpureum]EGC38367.1 hypothetical protein DICPUDRAFT_45888 [Dictyostelium purpureum]|eukprot:XP_003285124.1 hypothetical protein DICPUDRAFT_45888 [Dictyostelium purpureum]